MKIKSESKTLRPDALTSAMGQVRSGALTPSPSPTGEGENTKNRLYRDGFAVYTAVWKITPSAFSVY